MKTYEPKSETIKDDDVWIPTSCAMCYTHCGIKVHRVNGVVVNIEGDPDSPQGLGRLCAKGAASIMSQYNPRLKVPLKRTNPERGIGVDPQWVEITWEEALDTIVQKLKKVREEDPRKFVLSQFDLEAHFFALQVATGAAFGTPNADFIGPADYFCGNGFHPSAYLAVGSFHMEPDLEYCRYLMLIGSQYGFMIGEDAVRQSGHMADARMRGMKVVVVDPVLTPAANKANEWLPIRPGTDAALALAMINVLLNELIIYDAEFIKKDTNGPYLIGPDGHYLRDKATSKPLIWDSEEGKAKTYDSPDTKGFALEGRYEVDGISASPAFQLLKEHVGKYTCEDASKITTIPAETIRRIAKEFGEAARIGSKIVIEGKELPYRPACAYFRKGVVAHKHSMLSSYAIQLLNVIVGSVDVPGGILNVSATLLLNSVTSSSWMPREDADGMMVTGMLGPPPIAYPAREVKRPEALSLFELFPVAPYSDTLVPITVMNPEKFRIPYKPEVLLHCHSNLMMGTVDPKQVAEWLKKFSFIFSFAQEIDETVEFDDIVLPEANYLERLSPPLANWFNETAGEGLGDWCWQLRQPVVEPPPGIRSWLEVWLEIADRAGFRRDLYHMINVLHNLKEPYKLDLDKKYSWEEIIDIWAKSTFGPEHDLAWFKEHGFISFPKKVEETYQRPFIKARIPIYLEHFLKAGQDVKRVTEEMGIPDWDISDYQPLPDWKPCPPYERKSQDYDLYAVNYKLLAHTWSRTIDNVWLSEMGDYDPYAYYILINSQTAKRKGIRDGDLICLQTERGDRVEGEAKVTECVHPEVVGIGGTFGHWAKGLPVAKGKGVHFNTLIPINLECIDKVSAAVDCCVKVKVSKVS